MTRTVTANWRFLTFGLFIFALAVVLLGPPPHIQAAVVFDNNSSADTGTTSDPTSLTWSHTTTTGSNRILIVGLSFRRKDVTAVPVAQSVTYGGSSLTNCGYKETDVNSVSMELWYMVAPATGNNDVVVTLADASHNNGFVGGAVTFTGVDQSTPLGTFAGAYGNNTLATVSVSSASGDVVVGVVAVKDYSETVTTPGDQSEKWKRYSNHPTDSSYNPWGVGSTEGATGSSVTMSYDIPSSARWAIGGIAIKPAASGPTITLANHASGQVGDKFTTTSPVTDVLYRFKLTRSDTVTVDTLRVNFTTTGGVANGDVANGQLWEDTNGNGTWDDTGGGDTLIEGSVTPSDGVLTFATNFTPGTSGTTYFVRATVSNLEAGDTTTFSVSAADIDEVEGGVTESGSITNAVHTQDNPANLTQIHYRWRNDDGGEVATGSIALTTTSSDTGLLSDHSGQPFWTHTVNSGSNQILIVGVAVDSESASVISAITYNGDALTRLDTAASGGSVEVDFWYLLNPDVGANQTIQMTASGSAEDYAAIAMTFSGVHQATPFGTHKTANGSSGTASVTGVSSAAGELVVDVVGANGNGGNLTPDPSQTPLKAIDQGNVSVESSSKAGAASVDMSWTLEVSDAWAIIAVPLKPAAAGSGATFAADQDTKLTRLFKSVPSRVRFEVSNEGGESSGGVTYQLQVAQTLTCSSGSYIPVPTDTSGHWQIVGSTYITDGEATSNINPGLTDEATTFVAGQLKDAGNTTGSITLNSNEFTEIEFAVQATTNATDGANYCFILYNTTGGAPLGTYSVYAEAAILFPTAVTLSSFEATAFEEAVLLKWRTGHEVNNLGFNVYREANGELLRLTPELIAGSALLAGSGTPLTAGHHYIWMDTPLRSTQHSALSTIRYWLEDVDLNGKHTWHGPVETLLPAPSSPLHASEVRRAELLSEFGARLQEKYADFWKIQDFKEKLARNPIKSASILKGRRPAPQAKRLALSTQHSALRTSGPRANVSLSSVDERNEAPAGRKLSAPLSDKPLKQSSEAQWSLAARPAMKLLVKEEGWYRVSQTELAAAGMNTNFNPRHLSLYVDGNELPIRVIAEKESQFGPRDAIEFYGIGLDTPSTDTRVYWLVVGPKPGKRINSHISSSQFRPWSGLVDNPQSAIRNSFESPQSRNPQSAIRNSFESSQFRNPQSAIRNSFESFPYTAEAKERSFYFPALLNGEESNFFGPIIYTYRVDKLLYVWDADPSSPEDALLEVALQGATSGPHRVKVFFNDAEVGEVSFSGQSQARFQAEIPVSALHAGENLVSFIAHGGEMDVSLLDYIHLTYWRNYRAHENALKLTAQGGRQVSVTGFSHAQIQVVDITDPLGVVEVEGRVIKQGSGSGSSYGVTFRVPGTGPRTLLALAAEKAKSPAQLVLNQHSNWHQGMRGHDLVIISHKDFLESLKPLKALREAQGLSVALVDVEDVYDEFSFGAKSPQAIKDFLQRAKSSWQKAPRFVLLAGDASSDPRNYLGYGNFDFVPTKLVDTAYLETSSDDWLVDFDGDGLPKMALGRLPVQTPQEASAMVAKIIAYEKSSGVNEALLVADKTEKTDDFDFAEAAQKVGALFPSAVGVRKVFRGEYGSDAQAKEALLNYLGQGPLLVNYLGHGGMMEWRGHVLTADDAEGLLNGQRLPFFINMTCLNGFFQAPFADSLAEALLKAEQGGAVAVWTSSGMTEPGAQLKMNQELVRQLFSGEDVTIGEAAMKAKRAVSDKDIRRTWILFGDPATKLKY